MRQKIVLRRRIVPLKVTLPKGTPFAARYKRTRTIGLRKRRTRKKKVRFALVNTPTQDRAKRIKKKYSRLRHAQTGCGLIGNLAKLGLKG